MQPVPHTIVCVALIVSILLVAMAGEGPLATTAMTALTAALAVAISWFFGGRAPRQYWQSIARIGPRGNRNVHRLTSRRGK